MAKVKVLAGDFIGVANNTFTGNAFILTPKNSFSSVKYDVGRDIKELQETNEKDSKSISGALGWGTVGAIAAGPVGAIVGGLLGGKSKKTIFVAVFSDSRRLMGEIDSDAWNKIMATRMGI